MVEDQEDFNEYDEKIRDVDEVVGSDVKINPDYYLHFALLKAQGALSNPDVKSGFMQFRIIVEHIEILARAAGMIPADYETQVNAYKLTDDYIKESDITIKFVKLGNKKLEYILSNVFSAKVSTTPMKA